MQPCSREMQGLNSLFDNNHHTEQIQMNNNHSLDHMDPTSQDDFLKHMLSTLPNSSSSPFWGDLNPPSNSAQTTTPSAVDNVAAFPYDEHAALASKFRNHQISSATSSSTKAAAAALMLQHQLLMARGGVSAADSGLLQMPLSLGGAGPAAADFDSARNDVVDGSSSFKSPNPQAGEGSVHAMYNGFAGSLQGTALASNHTTHHFQHPQGQGGSNPMMQGQSFGGSGGGANQAPGGGNPGQPKQRVRARRGQATDPHSIAERLRRERIAERMKALQELVPNANKTDKASMLDEIIDYVKFLQLQVKVLSMSRLGGAAAVAPLVADITSEGGGDCVQANASGGAHPRNPNGNQTTPCSSNDNSLTMTEHQVAKLMEEDMGSAMQYLQGKGLCLMPISLATAISTATCHSRNPLINNRNYPVIASNGDGPSSPGMSVLTVQSGSVANGDAVKDAASVSKP